MEDVRPRAPRTAPQHDASSQEAPSAPVSAADPHLADVGAVFIRWEKLRIPYNLVLALWTFALTGLLLFTPWLSFRFIDNVVLGAILANLAFTSGTVIEAYITWFIGPNRWISPILFTLGTLFSMLLAAASVFSTPF